MTLSRILTLLLMIIFTIVLAGTLWISFNNSRLFLQSQLGTHAQDTATFLGLTISTVPDGTAPGVAESMVDPIFDRGYYHAISLQTIDGRLLINKQQPILIQDVPGWFVKWLPLEPPFGNAAVLSGWKEVGTIHVASHPGHAYAELWQNFTGILLWGALVWVMATMALMAVLHFFLRPLRVMENMAVKIGQHEFVTIDTRPRTRELRRVVSAMNQMSDKLKAGFEQQARLSKNLHDLAYQDTVTGLANKNAFQMKLDYLIRTPDEFAGGALLLIHMNNFAGYNQKYGHAAGDALLVTTAELFESLCHQTGRHVIIARLTGAQFGILFPSWTTEGITQFAGQLIHKTDHLHQQTDHSTPFTVHCGLAFFSGHKTAGELLADADSGLRGARQNGKSGWYRAHAGKEAFTVGLGADQLRSLLKKQLDNKGVMIQTSPVIDLQENTIYHNEVWARIPDENGCLLPAQSFIPIAEQMGCVPDIDRGVIEAVFQKIEMSTRETECHAVNLSIASLTDGVFMNWLCGKLKHNQPYLQHMAFECRESDLAANLATLKTPIHRIINTGALFGVDHFGAGQTGQQSFKYLMDINPSYIKIDGVFFQDTKIFEENRFYIQAMAGAVHNIGIQLIAIGVQDAGMLPSLNEIGIDAVQGNRLT